MKKAILCFALACIALGPLSLASGKLSQDKDLAAVMKVVQRAEASASPSSLPARQEAEATVLKLMIEDSWDGEKLSISLPLSWVEWLAEWDEDRSLDDWADRDDIKLKDVLDKLKSLGRTELIEISGKDGLIRIWLE